MTRAALLITNPGEMNSKNYCKGVYVDIQAYERLLLSPQGGAWNSSEIKKLDRPDLSDVRKWITAVASTDYCLVMFTGHGCFSSIDHDRILELKDGHSIASKEFLAGCKKCNLILDCCQVIHHESLLEKSAAVLNASRATELRTPNRARCRAIYDHAIGACSSGYVRATSCSVGEKSWDDDSSGGKYNSTLIRVIDNWSRSQASQWNGGDAVLSLVEAHSAASPLVSNSSGGNQNPSIDKDRTGPYFPIAVFG